MNRNPIVSSALISDRHADVLKGRIAKEDMMAFMTSDVLREVPLILETPSAETELANLRMLV